MNLAWTVDHTKNQWVDLGIHTEVCMSQSKTCGVVGGAFGMWFSIVTCPLWAEIISSKIDGGTGSALYCRLDHKMQVF